MFPAQHTCCPMAWPECFVALVGTAISCAGSGSQLPVDYILFHMHHHRWSLLQPVPRPQGPEEVSWPWMAQGSSSYCKLTAHIWNSGQMPGPLDGEAGILSFRTKQEELHSPEAFLDGYSSPAHTAGVEWGTNGTEA